MITAAQLRAARGLIDWTRNELAKAANISPETVKNIEHGIFRPQEQTAEAIVRTFAAHGVEFTDSEGVKKTSQAITTFEGYEGFKSFMDDLHRTALTESSLNGEKPICVCNVDNNLFKKFLGDYTDLHVERMAKIDGLNIRMLATKPEEYKTLSSKYMDCRYIPEEQSLPFYVYGDNFAIINFAVERNAPHITVIHSAVVARAYRGQFDVMWNSALTELKKK
jgi:DNA-binding XRE family transcriptional regulator